MFVVLLKFAENRSKAPEFMEGHNAWLKAGFDDDEHWTSPFLSLSKTQL